MIGSSLLFVHDRNQASIWLIDFAKTISLPSGTNITHVNEWIVGNHEDGYLIGINNLIQIFEEIVASDAESELLNSQTNENEAEVGEDQMQQNESTSNPINYDDVECVETSENIDLPQEIDAMKIHLHHEDNCDRGE